MLAESFNFSRDHHFLDPRKGKKAYFVAFLKRPPRQTDRLELVRNRGWVVLDQGEISRLMHEDDVTLDVSVAGYCDDDVGKHIQTGGHGDAKLGVKNQAVTARLTSFISSGIHEGVVLREDHAVKDFFYCVVVLLEQPPLRGRFDESSRD